MSRAEWREPTSLLPLHWGDYLDRYLVGLVLIIGGAVQVEGSNTYTLPLLLLGTVAHALGWSILPAGGGRRIIAVIAATGQAWVMLAGPQSLWTLAIPFLAWLLVRHRPLRSYLTAVLPLANGLILAQLFREFSGMLLALAISLAVLVASAWLARALAATAPVAPVTPRAN